nr:MAG: CPBP family intramembrane metalloprotease [Hyphomicrobiales bacterium]
MTADPAYGLQQELRPKPPRWGAWSTLLWMSLIGVVYILAQLISVPLFLFWWEAAYPNQPLDLAELATNGPLLGVVTLASNFAAIGVVALAVSLSRLSFEHYLALRRPSWRILAVGLGLTVVLLFTADFITVLSGRNVIPEFMTGIFETSRDASTGFFILLGVTLIVLAPLGEEIVFRGFFYHGLNSSFGPVPAILITAASWAVLHAQYEPFFMAQVFAYGIFLGWMRWRTGSLVLVMILHALINALALNQAVAAYGT